MPSDVVPIGGRAQVTIHVSVTGHGRWIARCDEHGSIPLGDQRPDRSHVEAAAYNHARRDHDDRARVLVP